MSKPRPISQQRPKPKPKAQRKPQPTPIQLYSARNASINVQAKRPANRRTSASLHVSTNTYLALMFQADYKGFEQKLVDDSTAIDHLQIMFKFK